MSNPVVLSTGDVIDADHVVAVMYEPWQKSDGYVKSHRLVVVFTSGTSIEYDYDSKEEAEQARDALIAKVR